MPWVYGAVWSMIVITSYSIHYTKLYDIGVFYREEFDEVGDLKEKYRAILNRDDKKRRKKEAPPSNEPASE